MVRSDYALTPIQRADARSALALLDGTGISLEEAARRAVQGRKAMRRVKAEIAADEFVRSRLALRPRTAEWYEQKLRHFTAKFGERMFDDITRPEFRAWIASEPRPGMQVGLARACRALWNWAIAAEPQLASVDVTAGLPTTSSSNKGDADHLTVDEAKKIMANAGPYRAALALMLFAGVRPEEIHGRDKAPLLWRSVNIAEKIIRIPANISKTGKERVLDDIPGTVWRFLEDPKNITAPVSPARTRQALERAQAAIGRWSHDITRHTFGTYAFASFKDAGKVAHWMGHEGNPTMLHRHYRGIQTKAEGDKFWAIS